MPWSVAFMVVAIVLVVTLGRVSKEKYRALGRQEGHPAADDAAREEVKRLKDRVQVLERVITDGRQGHDLDREIERLRER